MYALTEVPSAVSPSAPAPRHGTTRPRASMTGRPLTPLVRPRPPERTPGARRPNPAVYRRRRLVAGAAVVVAASGLAAAVERATGGTVAGLVFERVVAISVVVMWAWCAVALLGPHRRRTAPRRPPAGAEPEVSCLASGSAPGLASLSG